MLLGKIDKSGKIQGLENKLRIGNQLRMLSLSMTRFKSVPWESALLNSLQLHEADWLGKPEDEHIPLQCSLITPKPDHG